MARSQKQNCRDHHRLYFSHVGKKGRISSPVFPCFEAEELRRIPTSFSAMAHTWRRRDFRDPPTGLLKETGFLNSHSVLPSYPIPSLGQRVLLRWLLPA